MKKKPTHVYAARNKFGHLFAFDYFRTGVANQLREAYPGMTLRQIAAKYKITIVKLAVKEIK